MSRRFARADAEIQTPGLLVAVTSFDPSATKRQLSGTSLPGNSSRRSEATRTDCRRNSSSSTSSALTRPPVLVGLARVADRVPLAS
jgi:hypothetical protein